jgi:hypothetical protein
MNIGRLDALYLKDLGPALASLLTLGPKWADQLLCVETPLEGRLHVESIAATCPNVSTGASGLSIGSPMVLSSGRIEYRCC